MLACAGAGEAAGRPLIVMAGDSTTFGTSYYNGPPVAVTSAVALERLLHTVPPGTPWRGARVVNLGVPASTSADWAAPFTGCQRDLDRLSAAACARGLSLAGAVVPLLGRSPDVVLLTIGINDDQAKLDAGGTVDNIERIRDALAPSRVLVAVPFVTFSAREPRRQAIRQELTKRRLLTGPDWPPLPTADRIHLQEGSNVAAAGLWWNVLRGVRP
jgi:lysophospholipase L1-like esterase